MGTLTHKQHIAKLQAYLLKLRRQSAQLNSTHSIHIRHCLKDPALFYSGLFQTTDQQLPAYLTELENNITKLDKLGDIKNSEVRELVLTKVEHQFRAIAATLATTFTTKTASINSAQLSGSGELRADEFRNEKGRDGGLRVGEQPGEYRVEGKRDYQKITADLLTKSHQLYQKLEQQLEYERRLTAMIDQQVAQLAVAPNTQRSVLQERINHTKQRLQRCEAATAKVRARLCRYEEKKDKL